MVLGVCGNAVSLRDGAWHTHHSFGRIVALLAPRFKELRYFAPEIAPEFGPTCDFALPLGNVQVYAWPAWRNSLVAMKRPDRLARRYWQVVAESDVVFLRGSWPLSWLVHGFAGLRGRRVVHWVVTDARQVMRGSPRGYGRALQAVGLVFARFEQIMTRLAAMMTGSHILANGAVLSRIYRTSRTETVISTSIGAKDFHEREDTCTGDSVRILFVGFVRPEKGIEYLLRAMAALDLGRSGFPAAVSLAIVGSWGKFSAEHDRLCVLARELGIEQRITWEGYASFGRELFDQMDRSDLLVLPSLSEGTPRVLVEARARSLAVIATDVGGIPSSVTHEKDGLLVPPRDATALANAITRIITDEALRRSLILDGRQRVAELTVERFVDKIVSLLT